MSNSKQTKALLVHPPVTGLSIPPWAPAQTAMHLAGSGVCVEQYDANFDFFLNHLLTSKRLAELVNVIKKRAKQGTFKKAEPYAASLAADLAANPDKWNRKIDNIGNSFKLLKTEDFFRPELFLAALKNIDALLNLASLAFYPSRIQRRCFTNPALPILQSRIGLRSTPLWKIGRPTRFFFYATTDWQPDLKARN